MQQPPLVMLPNFSLDLCSNCGNNQQLEVGSWLAENAWNPDYIAFVAGKSQVSLPKQSRLRAFEPAPQSNRRILPL
jgi:hypothetical protein